MYLHQNTAYLLCLVLKISINLLEFSTLHYSMIANSVRLVSYFIQFISEKIIYTLFDIAYI
ncbi:MAG: hypothetical protein ACI92I_000140 [Acidimicrobiales bacterium]|jgi:hypothetical protein